jgi:dCTP deaminase
MVLSDADIRQAMKEGELDIEPFLEKSLTPNGYDLSAGSVLVPSTGARTDKGSARIPPKSWFVVGTVERVRLGRGLCGQLWLRSSFARKGMLATFGKVDAGFDGSLTVSAFNASEAVFEMPLGERFCQIVVERLDSPAEKAYAERSGRFQHQTGITLEARGVQGAGCRVQGAEGGGEGASGRVQGAGCRVQGAGSGGEGALGKGRGVGGGGTDGPAPEAGDSPCRRHGCDLCCRATEMPLTAADIGRIRELGFEPRYFAEAIDGWLQLRNTADGRCFFLHEGLCSIYPYRPEGCALYPVVFDIDGGRAVADPDCPHGGEWPVTAEGARRVRCLVERLQRERRDRRRRRAR